MKVRNLRIAASILISYFCLLSCSAQMPQPLSSAQTSSAPGDKRDYFPFDAGSKWDYSVNTVAPDGSAEKHRYAIYVEGEEFINGNKYLKSINISTIGDRTVRETSYTRRTEEGIYKVNTNRPEKPEYLMWPLPLAVGKTWTAEHPEGATHYKVEGVETVETSNQKYDKCLRISFEWDEKDASRRGYLKGISYRAAGVGEIKSVAEYKIKGGQMKITLTLESYKR